MEFARLDLEDGITLRTGTAGLGPDNRARILLLQGRSEFLEKYDEVITWLVGRGFGVISFDWRGQGLSTRLLPNPQKGHIDSYEDYLIDLDAVVSRVATADWDGPLVLLAHSLGAHVGLRYVIRKPETFTAAVFVAPMWRLPLNRAGLLFARFYTGITAALGCGSFYAPLKRDYDPDKDRFDGNLLTGSTARFERAKALKTGNPGLRLGGPTLGWIAASIGSVRALEAELRAAPPPLPVLVLSPTDERVVDAGAHHEFPGLMPDANVITFQGARHEILMENDAILNAALEATEALIARVIGSNQRPR